ncbi:GNAT family N-acetyltransferase [Arthrobacter sp. D1-29]
MGIRICNAGLVTPNPGALSALLTADVDGGRFLLRRALRTDVAAIVGLLADDSLGAARESAEDLAPYEEAFGAIDADPNHLLVVGELVPPGEASGQVVATFQLSFLPGISRRGSWRAQIEAVRVAASLRGQGIGNLMLNWAIEESRTRGCTTMQLTTHKTRKDAHRFYERLGFDRSHEGMKLTL